MVSSPSRGKGGRSSSVGADFVRGRERDRTPRRVALPFKFKKRIDAVDAIMNYKFNPIGTRGFFINQQIKKVENELLSDVVLFWKGIAKEASDAKKAGRYANYCREEEILAGPSPLPYAGLGWALAPPLPFGRE